MKLSFKKQPKETGLRAVGNYNVAVDIKGDKKIVGWIQPKSWQNEFFTVWLHVKEGNSFRNLQLKFRGETEEETREWIKHCWGTICTTYTLHQLED